MEFVGFSWLSRDMCIEIGLRAGTSYFWR